MSHLFYHPAVYRSSRKLYVPVPFAASYLRRDLCYWCGFQPVHRITMSRYARQGFVTAIMVKKNLLSI